MVENNSIYYIKVSVGQELHTAADSPAHPGNDPPAKLTRWLLARFIPLLPVGQDHLQVPATWAALQAAASSNGEGREAQERRKEDGSHGLF